MKVLVTANQKGGVGKTAVTVHLAFDFLERGLRVAVVDLDTQANASYTLKQFDTGVKSSRLFDPATRLADLIPQQNEPALCLIASDPRLADLEKQQLADVGDAFKANVGALMNLGFDVVLIDTAPSLGVTMAAALYVAGYVLSPIELEAYSIQGIEKMVKAIANMRRVNTGLTFLGMAPSKVDARNPRHVRHLQELREAYPSHMISATIGLRSSIADALASGVPVWKIKKTAGRKAAAEVRALANFVCTRMEIAS